MLVYDFVDVCREHKYITVDKVNIKISDQLLLDIVEGYNKKGKKFKQVREIEGVLLEQINKIILNRPGYKADILTDVYMGFLYLDKEYNVKMNSKMKDVWDSKECNSANDRQNEIEHYPYTKYRDVTIYEIPGGCKRFHELMISKKNMVLFDIGTETKSYKRYAFPKTRMVYEELQKYTVDNLILLEKTQGIEHTNLLFHYLKTFNSLHEFNKVKDLIEMGMKIYPIFIRNQIVEIVWSYIQRQKYSAKSIVFAKKIFNHYIPLINNIYSEILKISWDKRYPILKKHRKWLDVLKLKVELFWNNYNNDDEAYISWIKSEGLNDWRGINRVEDCFFNVNIDSSYHLLMYSKCESIELLFGEKILLNVPKPINKLGIVINDMTIQKIERSRLLDEEKLLDRYYGLRKKSFKELKKAEKKVWKDKDFKIPKEKLEPMHIYALLHSIIVSKLNLSE